MPTNWLQKRPSGSKNVLGIGLEGPGVGPPAGFLVLLGSRAAGHLHCRYCVSEKPTSWLNNNPRRGSSSVIMLVS